LRQFRHNAVVDCALNAIRTNGRDVVFAQNYAVPVSEFVPKRLAPSDGTKNLSDRLRLGPTSFRQHTVNSLAHGLTEMPEMAPDLDKRPAKNKGISNLQEL